MQKVKDKFQAFLEGDYKVKTGYLWSIQQANKPPWAKIVWSRLSLPKHSFTARLLMHSKLPILQRIGRFLQLSSQQCTTCHQVEETQHHLFFECQFAQQIWTQFQQDWGVKIHSAEMGQYVQSLTKLQMPRRMRGVIYSMVSTIIYNIWMVRNKTMFKESSFPVNRILREEKKQVI